MSFSLRMSIDAPAHLPLSRREVADQIEALIAILDRFDGDPDEEPDLGWTSTYATGSTDDREDDADDGCEMDDDLEWSDEEERF